MIALIVLFAAGFAAEAGCVLWVRYAEHGLAGRVALISMGFAVATIAGLTETVREPALAPAWILGHGAGAYLSVRWAHRRR